MHDEYDHLRESADEAADVYTVYAADGRPIRREVGSGWGALHDPIPGEHVPGFGYPCLACGVRVRLLARPLTSPGRLFWRHVAGGEVG